jgi:mono/diheme cytochrome c family protein
MSRLRLHILLIIFLLAPLSHFGREAKAAAPEEPGSEILSFAKLPEFNIPAGKIIYERYCTFCHGIEGKGDGLNAFSLQERPADLSTILVDRSEQEVSDAIVSGGSAANKSGQMPSFAQTISAWELRALQRYLRGKMHPPTMPGTP